MSEISDRYRRRADAFEALILGVPEDRWTSPSPCEGWSARDVVAHVVGYTAHELRKTARTEPSPAPTPDVAKFFDEAVSFGNDHYAPRVPVSEDAPLQDRLPGLIGRDPDWEP